MPLIRPEATQFQSPDVTSINRVAGSQARAAKISGPRNYESGEVATGPQVEQSRKPVPPPLDRQADAGENIEPTPSSEKVWKAYPGEYAPPVNAAQPEIFGLFQHPSTFINDVNPGGPGAPGRGDNCGECARAVERNWRGEPQVAAAMTVKQIPGEPLSRMEEWIGSSAKNITYAEIANLLTEAGAGSSAIIGQYWKKNDEAHWCNAVNDAGRILVVDGQSGILEDWPPSTDGVGWDENLVANSIAIIRGTNGKVIT